MLGGRDWEGPPVSPRSGRPLLKLSKGTPAGEAERDPHKLDRFQREPTLEEGVAGFMRAGAVSVVLMGVDLPAMPTAPLPPSPAPPSPPAVPTASPAVPLVCVS